MPQYRILFRHPTYEDVNIYAAADDEACAAAARIHAAFRKPPAHYEVWEGERHIFCGGQIRVPSWLGQKLREYHRPDCMRTDAWMNPAPAKPQTHRTS